MLTQKKIIDNEKEIRKRLISGAQSQGVIRAGSSITSTFNPLQRQGLAFNASSNRKTLTQRAFAFAMEALQAQQALNMLL